MSSHLYTSLPTDQYDALLAHKKTTLIQNFADLYTAPFAVYPSVPSHYRLRCEFRIWHEGDQLYPVMYDRETKRRIRVDQFPAASKVINQALNEMFPLLQRDPELVERLFQADFLSTLSGELLITLQYHRPLDEAIWAEAARRFHRDLSATGLTFELIGRSAKQKIVLGRDYVNERLKVADRVLTYRQMENGFTQPNGEINQKMLAWALEQTQNSKGDLLELYCGNGNFSIALAQNFRQVLATEISKLSVHVAQHNIEQNQITNLTIVRLSAEELTQALLGTRQFRRLEGINLSQYDCQTVLVDPPRAGLDDQTLAMIAHYPKILYISCNPTTLKANLEQLIQTHRIESMALFDQFPYTEHAEVGTVLIKR